MTRGVKTNCLGSKLKVFHPQGSGLTCVSTFTTSEVKGYYHTVLLKQGSGVNRGPVNICLLDFFASSYNEILWSSGKITLKKNQVNNPPPGRPFWMGVVYLIVLVRFFDVTSTYGGLLMFPLHKASVQTLFPPNYPCRNSQVPSTLDRAQTAMYVHF